MGAHLDVCCDICGDQGVLEAIATCSRCKVSCEHVYCMRVCRKEVPEDWCCENCEHNKTKNIIMPTSAITEDISKLFSSNPLTNMPRDHGQLTKKTTIDREKKTQTGKVKPLSPEEVIKLSSGSKFSPVKNYARNNTVPYMKYKAASSPEKSSFKAASSPEKSTFKTKAFSSITLKANPSLVPLKQVNPSRHGTPHINATFRHQQIVKEPRESLASESVPRKVAFQPSVKEHKQENFQQKQAMDAPIVIALTKMAAPKDIASTKMDAPKDTSSTKMDAPKDIPSTKMAASMVEKDTIRTLPVGESITKDGQLALKSGGPASPDTVLMTANTSAFTKSVPSGVDQCLYSPIPRHFWMGSFRVTDNAKFGEDQMQAHHPSRVHKMVYEFSKKMPAVLNFELVDRKGIWVKMFPDYTPDQKDIALYFKPSNGMRSSNYISILEHLQAKDLGLRMVMDRTELLVFASKALHADCQKWEGSYFLWGIFRHKKVLKAAAGPLDLYVADHNQEDNDGVDMEIDMVGGLDVGPKDIVVPKTRLLLPTPALKIEPCGDIPPGFDSTHKLSPQTPRDKNGGSSSGGGGGGGEKQVKVEPPD